MSLSFNGNQREQTIVNNILDMYQNDEPSFWEHYNRYMMSDYNFGKDEELLNRIEANPPPIEPVELDPAIEPMAA